MINDFLSTLVKQGTVTPSRYLIEIDGLNGRTNELLSFACTQAVLPSKGFLTSDVRVYNTNRKVPYGQLFTNEFGLTFRVSRNMFERALVEAWLNTVMIEKTKDFAYPNEYERGMKVYQLDRNDKIIYAVYFKNCYPAQLQESQLDSSANDQLQTSTVSIAFKDWESIDPVTGASKVTDPAILEDGYVRSSSQSGITFASDNQGVRDKQFAKLQSIDGDTFTIGFNGQSETVFRAVDGKIIQVTQPTSLTDILRRATGAGLDQLPKVLGTGGKLIPF